MVLPGRNPIICIALCRKVNDNQWSSADRESIRTKLCEQSVLSSLKFLNQLREIQPPNGKKCSQLSEMRGKTASQKSRWIRHPRSLDCKRIAELLHL